MKDHNVLPIDPRKKNFLVFLRILSTLVSHRGTPRASTHLTLDFVVPYPLSLPSLQTKDIFGQTHSVLTIEGGGSIKKLVTHI